MYQIFKKFGRLQPCLYKIPIRNYRFCISTCITRYQPLIARCSKSRNVCIPKRCISHTKQLYNIPNFWNNQRKQHITSAYYLGSAGLLVFALSYAAVPLYRVFCRATGFGGVVIIQNEGDIIEKLELNEKRTIKITFKADTAATMQWNFKPHQDTIYVHPGETVLAFYKAFNPTNKQVIGVSTYNVLPFEAGPYFNKIQCFCFEEQMLNPNEEVSMPVFFYIDPEYDNDPKLEFVREIILSYTFFSVKEGMNYLLPIKKLEK